jgi:hypothetical protein
VAMLRSIRRPKQSVADKLSQLSGSLAVLRHRDPPSSGRFRDYSVYGVSLRSQFVLPQFRATQEKRLPLIVISKSKSRLSSRSDDSSPWFFQENLDDGSIYLRWSSLFEFVVSADGHKIIARPLEKSSAEAFSTYLLGQVLSFALVKRGLESLHSSAAVVDGGCVGFLGDCGQGKSTLLASFVAAGYKQLTDDLLVLKPNASSVVAFPGPPRIKLMPNSAHLLGADGPSMNDLVQKKVISLGGMQVQQSPVRLRALYLLAQASNSEETKIAVLNGRKALLALVKNSFNVMINDRDRLKQQFAWAAAIASTVPVRTISYPRNLQLLPQVRAAILKDIETLPG